jgi:hypothetical protein
MMFGNASDVRRYSLTTAEGMRLIAQRLRRRGESSGEKTPPPPVLKPGSESVASPSSISEKSESNSSVQEGECSYPV